MVNPVYIESTSPSIDCNTRTNGFVMYPASREGSFCSLGGGFLGRLPIRLPIRIFIINAIPGLSQCSPNLSCVYGLNFRQPRYHLLRFKGQFDQGLYLNDLC